MVQWPKNLTDPSYDPLVLSLIAAGQFDHTFVPITVSAGGHTGVFRVSQDALKIDSVRINASAILQQQIADALGAYLVTPRIFDQMWAQKSLAILPCPMLINSTSEGMIKHSACIDKQIARPTSGVIQTVGKTWVLSNKLTMKIAMNMGWHLDKQMAGVPFDPAPTLPGAHMIQSPGTHHSPQHIDYSQVVLLVMRECVVDDQPATFASVAQNPALSALVSHEGVLHVLRQPGAPEAVTPPAITSKPPGTGTLAMTGAGAAAGAAIAGPPGALVGAAVGWAADTIRRKLS